MKCLKLIQSLVFSFILVSPCLSIAQDKPVTSNQEIVLGMSTALSGPTEYLGNNVRSGVVAGIEMVNRKGGIKGQKIRLVTYDDGYEPKRTTPNINKLIDEDKVLAIIGNVGTPTAIAAIPIVNEKKVLLFGTYSGASVLRHTPPDRYVINYRASYAEEIEAMIDALINDVGLKIGDIAFFTQRDGYGDAGFEGGIQSLKKYGLKNESAVPHVRYERNSLNVENAVSEILLLDHQPKAIILVGVHAPCAKFIKLIKENGLNPLFLNVSFVGSKPLSDLLGEEGEGVIVTHVVPYYNESYPIVREYLEDLKASSENHLPTFGSFEGYIVFRILELALEKIDGPIDREKLVDSLESLGTFDIGLGTTLKLDQNNHQACHTVWPTKRKNGKFVPFNWKELHQP